MVAIGSKYQGNLSSLLDFSHEFPLFEVGISAVLMHRFTDQNVDQDDSKRNGESAPSPLGLTCEKRSYPCYPDSDKAAFLAN